MLAFAALENPVSLPESPLSLSTVHLPSLSRPSLHRLFKELQQPSYRADQVFRWLHVRQVTDFAEMTDLPAGLRQILSETRPLGPLSVAETHQSQIDGSYKLVLQTVDAQAIETVVMPMGGEEGGAAHVTQCLSSQVGCKMGCDFCATARIATRRNLSAGEIVAQVSIACRLLAKEGLLRGGVAGGQVGPLASRPHNLVFMGMGEPLDNLEALCDALDILGDAKAYDFSPRRITVSTVGLAKQIAPLLARHPQVNLAWSLTATTDAVRDRLMPVNRGVPIARMLAALAAVPKLPHRKITFEYALLQGINDSPTDAQRLAAMAVNLGAHVNCIPFNAWPGSAYRRPERVVVRDFAEIIRRFGASVSVRESKGQDIGAACGQLAGRPAA